MDEFKNKNIIVIGAGPAGLTAGFEISKTKRFNVNILEKDKVVGGLSKTTVYNGCKFDIGPHHFLTHSDKVEVWWKKVMEGESKKGNKFIHLKRFTRIYYKRHFFHYPLQALDAILGLGLLEGFLCVLSYIKIRLFPIKKVESFQDWVTNQFGYRLFSIFFKTYTEKVWGINCNQISSDWASERIKGFSLSKAIFYAFFGKFFKKNAPRTLADTFYYPELGAGTLWSKTADIILENNNSQITLNEKVIQIKHEDKNIKSILTYNTSLGVHALKKFNEHICDFVFSTMPLRDLILALDPLPEEIVISAANKLSYRGLITVNLIVNKKNICPDHWLYIHEKTVEMGRVGNMNNFSLKMSDNKNHTALSLEYFSFVDSDFWNKSDTELLELGKIELEKIGLVNKNLILNGMILREHEAYPVYDKNYKENLNIVKNYLLKFNNLYLMGRNGLHQYNNMDIAMLSAFDATEKFLGNFDRENIYLAGHKKNIELNL
ncbi:MAG: hypothetical protein SZ59_C0002G0285 [candidate division TM6 bacterium GW2011_GWF2_28_16]|nr:MAG: hypothetical protein SZ59_C0002G0285 [candidate division TM6 bacterium GW2011_GWF2_28_16]